MQESCAFQPLFLPGTKNVNILDTIKQDTPIVMPMALIKFAA